MAGTAGVERGAGSAYRVNGRETRARIEDCADLAAYIMLGALCPACARGPTTTPRTAR